jgi:hypothetical protein
MTPGVAAYLIKSFDSAQTKWRAAAMRDLG